MPVPVALIPARGGSKRVARKNIRLLGGRPLVVYAIAAALRTGLFRQVIVSTEDDEITEVAARAGARVIRRPAEFAQDHSPDIEWVDYTIRTLDDDGLPYDCFALLRPTSPFRQPATIFEAWQLWCQKGERYDSLRAVAPAPVSPGKMWQMNEQTSSGPMQHFYDFGLSDPPAHSRATQSLPKVYVQTAGLEIAWKKTVLEQGSISGQRIMPYHMPWPHRLDLNDENDWLLAETLIQRRMARLPEVA